MMKKLMVAVILVATLCTADAAMAYGRHHRRYPPHGGLYVGYEDCGYGIEIRIPLPGPHDHRRYRPRHDYYRRHRQERYHRGW
ncbi:MAG: hypothetical protein LBD04_07835 [Synergistaceae bacterium]|jgi:hypothetical protein|nr:hypothetical protein [Synergistaceae bacterium]